MTENILSRSVKKTGYKRRGPPPGYMPSPKSLANLIPYKPGENGHQFGGYNLTERLKHAVFKNPEKADELVESTLQGAILREPTPFREVWDRVEGRLTDQHAILGDIVIEVVYGSRSTPQDQDTGSITGTPLLPTPDS